MNDLKDLFQTYFDKHVSVKKSGYKLGRLFDHLLPLIHRYNGLVFIFFHIFDFSLKHLDNFNEARHKAYLMKENFRVNKVFLFFQREINIIKLGCIKLG